MNLKNYMPAILDSRGNVVGMGGGTAADHAEAERAAQIQREAEGPPTALESEIRALLGLPRYDETDAFSPWVAVRATGFPRPYTCEITKLPGQPEQYGDCAWDRRAVRQWLAHFDAVAATIQPPAKRHRHVR